MFRKITALAAALATTATLAVVAVPADAASYMDPSGEDTTYTYELDGTHTIESESTNDYESGDAGEYCQEQTEMANRWVALARHNQANGHFALMEHNLENAATTAGRANKDGCNIHQPE